LDLYSCYTQRSPRTPRNRTSIPFPTKSRSGAENDILRAPLEAVDVADVDNGSEVKLVRPPVLLPVTTTTTWEVVVRRGFGVVLEVVGAVVEVENVDDVMEAEEEEVELDDDDDDEDDEEEVVEEVVDVEEDEIVLEVVELEVVDIVEE
jgi:hypothetical protein